MCKNQPVLLQAATSNNAAYQWMRNGVDLPGATQPGYLAVQYGKYKVRVTRTTTGCVKKSKTTRILYRKGITASITPGGPTTFCSGDSVTLAAYNFPGYSFKWKLNGAYIPGATGPAYTAKTAGAYKVVVTDPWGCSKGSQPVDVIVNCRQAGAYPEPAKEFSATVTPNPATETAVVHWTARDGHTPRIEVLDASGRPLYPVVPGGESQREMALRTGINIVMHALTGNYKADQVHVPALLERLGQ